MSGAAALVAGGEEVGEAAFGAEGRQQPEAHGEGHEGDCKVEAVLRAQGRLHGREGELAAQEQEVRGGQVEHVDGEGALLDVEAKVPEHQRVPQQSPEAHGQGEVENHAAEGPPDPWHAGWLAGRPAGRTLEGSDRRRVVSTQAHPEAARWPLSGQRPALQAP